MNSDEPAPKFQGRLMQTWTPATVMVVAVVIIAAATAAIILINRYNDPCVEPNRNEARCRVNIVRDLDL